MMPEAHADYLVWLENWSLDVDFMDRDHRHIAALVNAIARDFGVHSIPDPISRGAMSVSPGSSEKQRESVVPESEAPRSSVAATAEGGTTTLSGANGVHRDRKPAYDLHDPEPLHDALMDLARATREHFEREEAEMRDRDFPGFREHKSEHDMLLAELSMLARDLSESGTERLSLDILDSLKIWFLGHVLELDRELAQFLNGQPSSRIPEPER